MAQKANISFSSGPKGKNKLLKWPKGVKIGFSVGPKGKFRLLKWTKG